ncbi:MAG: LacI family DNA-binding transcriptional regulator [Candidatus Latescibacteria bacterium]|nr:LacI family DNA-binding transcriptional regulator [Candidatus Latescibacterota bacterium]
MIKQRIVTERTGTLGLLTYQISRETFGRQTDHILRAADKQEYQVVMSMAAHRTPLAPLDDQTTQIKELISRGVDGLLINTRGDEEEAERIMNTVRGRVPVVTFHYPTPSLSGVVLGLITDFFEATEHLIRLGHERIGFIGPDWNEASPVSAKAKGYLLAMQKHGLPHEFLPALGIHAKGGYLQSKRLGDRFTALVCRDDYTAMGVCRGLGELGLRVPEDVAVVGSGDLEVGTYAIPALTTLVTPYEAIAKAVMELMLEQLEGGRDEPRQITLKSRLVVRESCGANTSEK